MKTKAAYLFTLLLFASTVLAATKYLQTDTIKSADATKDWTFPTISTRLTGVSDTTTVYNKTFISPVINGGSVSGAAVSDTTITVLDTALTIVDDAALNRNVKFIVASLSSNRTVTFPNASGDMVLADAAQTLTNKTVSGTTSTNFNWFDSTFFTLNHSGGKRLNFNIDAAASNTTVTLTMPSATTTVASLSIPQTFSASQTYSENNIFASGKGIDFSATSNASGTTNSEILTDYEDGTCTPLVHGTSTSGTVTYNIQSCSFTKIGRRVGVDVYVNWTTPASGGGGGGLAISGLPYVSTSTANYRSACSIGYADNISQTASTTLMGSISPSTSHMALYQVPVSGTTTSIGYDTSGLIMFHCDYMTN